MSDNDLRIIIALQLILFALVVKLDKDELIAWLIIGTISTLITLITNTISKGDKNDTAP